MTRLPSITLLACLLGALSAVHGAVATLSSAQHEPQAQVDDSHQLHAIQHFSKISGRTMPPPIQVRNEDQTTRVKRADDGLTYHYDGYYFMSYFNDPTCSTAPLYTSSTGIGVCAYNEKITEVVIDPSLSNMKLTYSYYRDASCTQLDSTYVDSYQLGCNYYSLFGWSQNVTLPSGTPAEGGLLSYSQYASSDCTTGKKEQEFTPLDNCTYQSPTMSQSVRAITRDDGTVYKSEYTFNDSECNGQITYVSTNIVSTDCFYGRLSSLVQIADVPTGTTLGSIYVKQSNYYYYNESSRCATAPVQINYTYYGGLEVCLNPVYALGSFYSYYISVGAEVVKVTTSYATADCRGVVSRIRVVSFGECNGLVKTEVVLSIEPPAVNGILEQYFNSSDQCESNALPFRATWVPTGLCNGDHMYTCANNVGNISYYDGIGCLNNTIKVSTVGYTNCYSSQSDAVVAGCRQDCDGYHSVTCTSPWTPEPSPVPTQLPTARPSLRPTVKPTHRNARKPTVKPSQKPSKQPTKRPTKRPTNRPTKKPNRKPSQTTASVDTASASTSASASASASDVKRSMFDTLMAVIRGWANI